MDTPFDLTIPGPKARAADARIKTSLASAYKTICDELPESRARSLALTNLELCGLWAEKCANQSDPETEVIR